MDLGWTIAGLLVLSLVIGVGSACWFIFRPPVMPVVRNGPWITNLKVGSAAANMYVRAHIALTGLFALNKEETIYFRAYVDEDGNKLRADRDYMIVGSDIAARWWVIVLYGQDNHLIANDLDRYSFNGENLDRDADGSFRMLLSRMPKDGNWLPSGERQQHLSLSLKVYNPAPEFYVDPSTIALPRITMVPSS